MSSYHSAFGYLSKRSDTNFGWLISHFDSGDSGESDTFLSTDSVFSDSYNGTRRTIYGTKYNSVLTTNITVLKQNGEDFSISDIRSALQWLTGSQQATWLDLYTPISAQPIYRLLGHVQDVKQYKLDSRTVGLVITFESVSPWAYSTEQTFTKSIIPSDKTFQINNLSNDLYTYIYLKTIYKNTGGTNGTLSITNQTTGDVTTVKNLGLNETITISDNMMITSDNTTHQFGNDFNFVFPRLKPGINNFTIGGTGTLTFKYIYPIKIGDMTLDTDMTLGTPIVSGTTLVGDTLILDCGCSEIDE